MKLTVLAPAKLNLFLDITGKRHDGYHLVNMVMQTVSLYDEVTVALDDSDGIRIQCSDKSIPCDETNTAYRAAASFLSRLEGEKPGVSIRIKKRIPSQAGMAGGSTDAAAVLYALNELTEAGMEKDELAELAEETGTDVPFCVYGGTMTAGGIGTILSPLPDMPDCSIVIVKPELAVSTAEAYARSDALGYDKTVSSDDTVNAICNGSLSELGNSLYNKFEELSGLEEITSIKQMMESCGTCGALMTGSGSAVYGLFEDRDDAERCLDVLSGTYRQVYLVHPTSEGPVIK